MSSTAGPVAPQQPEGPPAGWPQHPEGPAEQAGAQQPVGADPQHPGPPGAQWQHHQPWPQPKQDRVSAFLERKWRQSPVWLAPAAALVCMGGAIGYTLASHPAGAEPGDAPSCLLKYVTGFVCPGCGGTRAAWYLLHADLPAAARHHALFVFAVPFLLWMYVAWAGRRVFGWKIPQLSISPGVLGAFIAVWGVFSVLRNLPWSPFSDLYV